MTVIVTEYIYKHTDSTQTKFDYILKQEIICSYSRLRYTLTSMTDKVIAQKEHLQLRRVITVNRYYNS